jgi:hypothetical protein
MHEGSALTFAEAYAPRPVRPMGVRAFGDWTLKVYGIAYGRDEPSPELVQAALRAADSALPAPARSDDRYGLGFLGIHDGRDSNFVFVSWWENENELQHRVFYSAPERPCELRPATPQEPIACVWDLSVIAHEREAWIRHVLSRPDRADPAAYLADALSANV